MSFKISKFCKPTLIGHNTHDKFVAAVVFRI